MSMGFGPIASRPIAGESSPPLIGTPLAMPWTNDTEIAAEWTNDATLTAEYEPSVEE